eukprot:8706065-Pyramimonas_sp.AAC.1
MRGAVPSLRPYGKPGVLRRLAVRTALYGSFTDPDLVNGATPEESEGPPAQLHRRFMPRWGLVESSTCTGVTTASLNPCTVDP